MTDLDLIHAQEAALHASEIAAKMLKAKFRTELNVTTKGHVDYVTELDSQCEEAIKTELGSFDESIAFIGEESTSFNVVNDKIDIELPDTCWIVDPLDGTSNYAHGFSGYCVSIALRVDKELKLAVVNAPSLREKFTTIAGKGAFSSFGDSDPEKISTIDNGDRFNIFATSLPFRYPEFIDQHLDLVRELFGVFEDMRRVGSAELDLSWTAKGIWAGFIERFLKPWDSSAGGLLVKESGGVITDWSGHEQDWLINGQILSCASARLHEKILNLIE